MAELKPCPFCGRIPNTYGCKIYGYYVVCDCGVEQSRIYKQKCDAVKHWNRRKTENSSEKPNNCEPQYEMGMGTLKCVNCSEYGSFKCTKCDGEMYFTRLEPNSEPQTERSE